MHFWHNNNSRIQDKVNAIYDSVDLDQENVKLIVSFDRSNLGTNSFSTFQQLNESIVTPTSLQQIPPSAISEEGSDIIENDGHLFTFRSGIQQTNRFILTPQEWQSIKPKIGCNKLLSNWTYIFNQKLSVFFPYCVIKFLYHRINMNSNIRDCCFIVAQAVCKFEKCVKFSLWIDEAPQLELDNLTVNFIAEGFLSKEHFDHTTAYSRKVSGQQREILGEKISTSSAINYHYDLFKKSDTLEAAKHGNINQLHSQQILRKVKSQYLAKRRFNDDMWEDIVITKKTYDSTIKGKAIDGYIQMISRYPIVIHMYSEEQLLILKSIDKNKLTLHLDATGSVVRKIDRDQKLFLYYALTLRHPQMKISPIPVAEMLSSNHTNVEITHFLHKWSYDVKLVLNHEICPDHIEVDFSWAMLHSICKIFNKEQLVDYLDACWYFVHNSQSNFDKKRSVLHICSAHLIHRISYKLERKMRTNKVVKRFIMFVMARLISSTEFEKFEQLFIALCMLCLARRKFPEIELYVNTIEKSFSFLEEEVVYEFDYIDEIDEELPNDFRDSSSYKKRSPFGRYFNTLLKKCQENIDKLEIKYKTTYFEENKDYYLPALPNFLVNHYMPICPIWSSLILGPVISPGEFNVRYSNAIAENWMRIIKSNILNNETKLRPGDFLRKMREGLEGRIRAFNFAFEPLSYKVFKRTKDFCTFQDTTLVEEIWQKRKKKCTYFKKNYSQKISLNFELKSDSVQNICNKRYNKQNIELKKTEPISKNKKKSITKKLYKDKISRKNRVIKSIKTEFSAEISSNDSIFLDDNPQDVTFYNHGEFCPVDQIWQKAKCKFLKLSYVNGVLYTNESKVKDLEIRELRPSKEKRISPDGNCLFSSLSFIITGSDHFHKEIREMLVENMRGPYREICSRYCCSKKDLLEEAHCYSIEQYINVSMIDRIGSWGTDMELFLAAQLLETDMFVYQDSSHCWNKFSGYGFIDRHDSHKLTEKRIYIRLYRNHFQPVVKVNSKDDVQSDTNSEIIH